MSASKLTSLLILTALIWAGLSAGAQAAPGLASDSTLLAQLEQSSGGAVQIARHAETGKVRFLALDTTRPLPQQATQASATPEQVARTFLGSYGQLFGLRDPRSELSLMQQEQAAGRSFVRFQQIYRGVPVLGGELIVQTTSKRGVASANGELLPDLGLSIQPRVTAEQARKTALAAIAKANSLQSADLTSSAPQLWIYNPALLGGPGLRINRLVWRSEVRPAAGDLPIRELVLIDAQTGALALHFNQIAHAKDRVVCNDNNVVDLDGNQDNNCVPGKYARTEGQGPTGIADVDLAYDYAGDTYDYFFNNFGRDSLDGKGLRLISLVKYCDPEEKCPYQNASWDGYQMTYGDGFASADDVVGHELAHGLTEFTSHLFYYYQSGAINESLSDVFGELIDQANGAGNDASSMRWLMGEDLDAEFGVIRNMKDPGSLPTSVPGPNFSPSPDRMTSGNYWSDRGDSGGVHTNSGVNNKAAYLMVDGGTFNGQTITGLGASKVGAIYYTLQTAFLTSASDYRDLYVALPAACRVLASAGSKGITAADCAEVQKAVTATEMDKNPTLAAAPDAPICPAGQSSRDLFYDDMENPNAGRWISSAQSGENAWFYPPSTNPFGVDFTYATSGKQNIWGYAQGGTDAEELPAGDIAIAMSSSVAVPANAYLHFRHAFEFESDSLGDYDGGVVEYSTNGGQTWQDAGSLMTDIGYNGTIRTGLGNPLAGRAAFVSISEGYVSTRLNLGTLSNQNVRFRFRIATDPLYDTYGWFIDDLRVYTCSATPPTVAWKSASQTVSETAGGIRLEIGMNGASDKVVTVPFTIGGTAVAGSDYRLTAGTIVIPPGQATGSVFVNIINNPASGPDKTLLLTLGTPENATLGNSKTQLTIQNAVLRYVYLPRTTK
ncbi:MAG TPA: M4 family metallopeptidase [Roseiflexaceae bacterium]|nr:M4 family metallopeptidase [Roseiflexaceae bacterium]